MADVEHTENIIDTSWRDLVALYNQAKARAEKAEKLLAGLSKRHEWQPELGPCICEWHEKTRAFLIEPKKEK